MSNQTVRRLVGGLGTALILVICGIVIGAFFVTERHLQRISIPKYVNVEADAEGGYTFTLDIERLMQAEHLIDPPEAERARHPEIEAIKTLGVRATESSGVYALETVSTTTDRQFNQTLKKGGIKLVDTQWQWTKEQAAALANENRGALKQLRYAEYVRTKRDADGAFQAAVDLKRLMADAGISESLDPEQDAGARAIRSLGISCTQRTDGYLLQATTIYADTINADLAASGVQIVGTSWVWSEAEMESHLGTVEIPAAYVPVTPEATPEPTVTPEPAETTAPETPSGTFHDVPGKTPEASATPARNADAIDSLYGFDQTELRKAIRAAKEAKYGSTLESSEIKFNYFAVGNEGTAHANVFRIVYAITTSNGAEHLIADVYDIERETGYRASDVVLTVAIDRNQWRSPEDLKDYTVYELEGGSMVFDENAGKSPFDSDGLVMAKSMEETVSFDELWNIPQTKDRTLLQLLGYARNEMFARGGHRFSDTSTYTTYFKQFSWYRPTGKVTVDALAAKYPKTRDNIETIQFLEKLIKEG